MDQRPPVWNASNIRHIERGRPERANARSEIDEVLNDPRRLEVVKNRNGVDYHTVIGSSDAGRLLLVVWVDHPDGRFPVHARRSGRRAAREYYQ
ncbi:MAG: hypothetical protein ABJB39_09365 [Chloroflexota bacterium]